MAPNDFNYDMIIGQDLLSKLGLILNFKENTVIWDEYEIPMKNVDATRKDSYYVEDSTAVNEATSRIKQILDAKYDPVNLDDVVAECTHLSDTEQQKLRN